MKAGHGLRWAAAAGLTIGLIATGCGTPGAPQAPSLKLPDPVTDLSAKRAGNQIALLWTMPKKNTDKLLLKGNVAVSVCRKEGAGSCISTGSPVLFAPGAEGSFTDALPVTLTAGDARVLRYFVELKNVRGRSAGLSNAAEVLAGEAPGPVAGLAAQVRKGGVVLRWTTEGEASGQPDSIAIRLHRKLLTPVTESKPKGKQGLLAAAPEALEQSLLVDSGVQSGRAIDTGILFGETYEYRAQRVARVTVDGKALELAGELSGPVRIEVKDVFPPAVPRGLAAVATAAENGTEASIDLSWQPVAEADLAGYAVYRREGDGSWGRISPAQPMVGPGFSDRHVEQGHTYRYAVSAIDQGGHESARSDETEETVPNQ
jgi:hypothetical protein